MTDFFSSLAERSFGTAAAIRPRLAFLFEPALPHGEPPADAGRQSESDAASGALEREPAWSAVERRGELAPERRLSYRPESDEHITRGPAAVPAPHPGVAAAPPLPVSGRQMVRVPVEEETKRPRREPAARDSRQDEAAQVAPRREAATAIPSVDSVRPEPGETAAGRKAAGGDEERGLLVPSKVGARIAANLQSAVSAASITSRDRRPGPQRGAESHHAHTERNVHVTIGRIEVRATVGEKTQARERPASAVMGLDEYLRRQARRGGQ
jgi:hypothetical protein